MSSTGYSSAQIPCTFTVPSTLPTDNGGIGSLFLVCVGSSDYIWNANGVAMSDGGIVTGNMHRWFISIDLSLNPSVVIYCQPD